jgi:hypothetical protein
MQMLRTRMSFRRLLISIAILVILFQGFGAKWIDTFYGIVLVGIAMLVTRAMLDLGKAIGSALSREQVNLTQNVTEHHRHGSGDPTAPPEAYPAVIEVRRERGKR